MFYSIHGFKNFVPNLPINSDNSPNMAAFSQWQLRLGFTSFMLFVTLLIMMSSIGSVCAQVRLKCYICHTSDNEQCQLQQCPTDQAYDRCMTTLYKNPEDGKHIKKECALAPCHLRGLGNLNFANFKSKCDSSNDQDCIFCCKEDGCNKDGGPTRVPLHPPLICLMLFLAACLVRH